ncbi:MAG TPA: hypothetical protein VF476_19600 [Chitinophagaceae bacterium]
MAKIKPIIKNIGEVSTEIKKEGLLTVFPVVKEKEIHIHLRVSEKVAADKIPKHFVLYRNNSFFWEIEPAKNQREFHTDLPMGALTIGTYSLTIFAVDNLDKVLTNDPWATLDFEIASNAEATLVRLARPGFEDTIDRELWDAISKRSLDFKDYSLFISRLLDFKSEVDFKFDNSKDSLNIGRTRKASVFLGGQEYNLLKFGTELYMLAKSALNQDEVKGYMSGYNALPYYEHISDTLKDIREEYTEFADDDSDSKEDIDSRLKTPFFIELIWSYWMEQGMLMQAMNLIALRFQNIDNGNLGQLARFDLSPLRRLNHILWGFIQDEQHRLSLPRRLREYDHEYGLTLSGRAVPAMTPADSRLKFLEAFHNLLTTTSIFFKEADDTTRIADAFPVLNSLKEVHLLLAEGNHNAYGNLTWTARNEMMMTQYIISRDETRVFLGGRPMVPYPEQWMDRIDTIRNMMGWGTTSITYFYDLAIHGEKILLSIRYGNWSDAHMPVFSAANWAMAFRDNIQKYIHGYRTVTGVDLSADASSSGSVTRTIQPSVLIQRRISDERLRQRRA